jgi:hypothetical protein
MNHIDSMVKDFNRDGYIIIEDALSTEQCIFFKHLLDKLDKQYPPSPGKHTVHTRLFEIAPKECLNVFKNEKVLPFIKEAIAFCGTSRRRDKDNSLDVHVMHNNAFKVPSGSRGQATIWHTDDPPLFTTRDGSNLPDTIVIAPMVLTCMYYLNDVRGAIDGMTHIIPGSQRFGTPCYPHIAKNLPSIAPAVKAGSVMIISSAIWHRGCNVSPEGNSRYLFQVSYGRRLVGHKFGSIMNYQLPKNVEQNLNNNEDRQLMGFLEGGSYS